MPHMQRYRGATPSRRALSSTAVTALLAIAIALFGAPAPAAAYDEGIIVALANKARADYGMPGVARNGALDAVALQWANQMAANGALSHNTSTGSQMPGGWTAWGENVAQGYATGAAAHEAG